MLRLILVYGLASGAAVIFTSLAFILLGGGHHNSLWLGYLVMLVGLSSILLAVKSYRDTAGGGVIRFLPAFGLGLAIAVLAGVVYVAVWDIYLALTNFAFVDQYAAALARRAADHGPAAMAKAAAEAEQVRRVYANPLMRWGMTFAEIFPVGLLVSLVSAALLRNPGFLPARARPAAAAV